ncbi:DUF5913 domain-containing protein, partial [bacterium]|nr:DUF5913 domain-containing protein [bacterium]
ANSHPSPAWLDIVKTASARNKIRRYLLESRWDELKDIGQNKLTKELRKAGFNALEFYNSEKAKTIAKSLKVKSIEDMFVNIGFGRISIKQVLARLLQPKTKPKTPKKEPKPTTQGSLVKLGDIDNIMYRLALCCNPLPGDDITGFVTRGRGVTIHKSSCRNIQHHNGEANRILPLFWEGNRSDRHIVSIEVRSHDRRNLLSELSQNVGSSGTDILSCHSESVGDLAVFHFKIEILSTSHLNSIMRQLLGVEGVKTVRRVRDEGASQTNPKKTKKNDAPVEPQTR